MGSQLKKGQVSESTANRVRYSYLGLYVFDLMQKLNTNAKGMHWKTKKKLSKAELCRFMAEHNKLFRAIYIQTHPNKKYPPISKMKLRSVIGDSFYRSNVADSRRSGRKQHIRKLYKKYFKEHESYYFLKGKKIKVKL